MELTDELLGGSIQVEKTFVVKTKAEGVDLKQDSISERSLKKHEKLVLEYANKYSVMITPNLEESINQRMKRNKACSFREMDCFHRQQTNLNDDFLWECLFEFCSTVFEEQPYIKNGVYELRSRFNAGIKWMKQNIGDSTKIEAGKERLSKLSAALHKLKFPLYMDEKKHGIEQEYLKPEWMTWDEYNKLIKFNKPHITYADPLLTK